MQIKKLAALVAIACSAGSASAALTAAQQATLTNAQSRVFFLAGASAVQGGLTTIESSLFNAGSFRLASASTGTKNFEAIAGTLAAGTGTWAGQEAIFIYRVLGGSVFGVNSVASPAGTGTAIQTLVVKAANCGASGSGTAGAPYVCDLSDGTVAKPDRIPDAGVSDVAPKFFKNPVNTEGETPAASLSETELAEFGDTAYNKPLFTLAFAPAVTNNTNVALNKANVAAIMTGNVSNWGQVDASLDTDPTAGVAGDDIVICRRVQGSGTQAVFNNYFGGFPCLPTSNAPAARDTSTAWIDSVDNDNYIPATAGHAVGDYYVTPGLGTPVVIENSSSSEVRKCLTAAANPAGASYGTFNRDGVAITVTFAPKTGGHRAIGVLSLDSVGSSDTRPDASAANGWSFRSLDGTGTLSCTGTCPATTAPVTAGTGKFPTAASLIDGTWDQQGWVSFNVPNRTISNTGKAGVAAALLTKAQDPAVLLGVNNFKWVAAALPTAISGFSGAGVSRAAYLNSDQCAPLNRNN